MQNQSQAAMPNDMIESLTDEEQLIYESMKAKSLPPTAQKIAQVTPLQKSSDEEKKVADMNHEEKMQWLDRKRAEGKEKRTRESMQRERESDKNQRNMSRAAADMKEKT